MVNNSAPRPEATTEGASFDPTGRTLNGTRAWGGAVIALAVAIVMLGPAQAGAQCLTDSDCNDGLFCTTDHCLAFICFHFDRDCNDFNDCTKDTCSETRNTCVHANLDFTAHCEDFNIFTTAERCDCGGKCIGLPTDTIFVNPVRCCVSADCASNSFCIDSVCQLAPTVPPATPTRTRTPTVTPTRTLSPTPDNRPVLTINDASDNEGDHGTKNLTFTVSLSKIINQQVTFNFATADGSATSGSDYRTKSGTASISANALTVQLPGITVLGDRVAEADETFFVNLSNVPSSVRVGRGSGVGTIVNDDGVPGGNPGIGALSPHDAVATVGVDTPVTLTWTNPQRWRDLATVDLRLRSETGIALWLRFDVAANTIGLIQPSDVSLGPVFAPGAAAELEGDAVTVVLAATTVQALGPDAPTVNVTFALRFGSEVAGKTYVVDAAATGVAGDVHDFDTLGTVSVAPAQACAGDCNHDGVVTVDELVLGVNVALGGMAVDSCPDLDTDGSGAVSVDELVAAVNAALQGCT